MQYKTKIILRYTRKKELNFNPITINVKWQSVGALLGKVELMCYNCIT